MRPDDLAGVDESLARRIISVARSIAPCLDSLTGDARDDAIAILKAVAAEVKSRGSRQVVSQHVGPATVTYDVGSAFTSDDRAALRDLCSTSPAVGGHPTGSFPKERPVGRVWPETY